MQESYPEDLTEEQAKEKKKFLREFLQSDSKQNILDEFDSRIKRNKHRVSTRRMIGRNEPCPCASGKKFKKCCINKADKV